MNQWNVECWMQHRNWGIRIISSRSLGDNKTIKYFQNLTASWNCIFLKYLLTLVNWCVLCNLILIIVWTLNVSHKHEAISGDLNPLDPNVLKVRMDSLKPAPDSPVLHHPGQGLSHIRSLVLLTSQGSVHRILHLANGNSLDREIKIISLKMKSILPWKMWCQRQNTSWGSSEAGRPFSCHRTEFPQTCSHPRASGRGDSKTEIL